MQSWQPRPLPQPVVLSGHWVALEPLSLSHAPDLWNAVRGEDHVWDWLADGPYSSQPELAKAIEAKEAGSSARFFAISPHLPGGTAGPARGYASLMRMDPANGVIEVGNVLFSPALQRTPAATEAMYLMARYVFEDLGYRRYEWKCNALNLPSRKAAQRLGFSYEGIFRKHMVLKGRSRDTAWYAMLDNHWPSRRAAFEEWLSPTNFDMQGRQLQPLARLADGIESL